MRHNILVQLNPALYWGKELIGFHNNEPNWQDDSRFLYDTHTAQLFTFSRREALELDLLKVQASKPIQLSALLSSHSEQLLEEFIQNEILLTGTRRIEFGNYSEAEIWLQANHFCNLACPGCATGMDVSQDKQKKFDLDVLEKCLKKVVVDAKERGFTSIKVKLGGGEPTLNGIEFIKGVSELCMKYSEETISLRPVLLTNGVALSDQFIRVLKEYRVHSSISTDPLRTIGKGRVRTFPLVLENIKKMKNEDASVSAQLTVSSINYRIVDEIYEQISDIGVHTHFSMFRPQTKEQLVYVRPEHVIEAMTKVYASAFRRANDKRFVGNITSFDYLRLSGVKDGVCGAGKTYIVLDVDGSIYSCHETIRDKKTGGNVLSDSVNVFDMINSAHVVPKSQRYTASLRGTEYSFMWQGGFGCPWVVKKEKGDYDQSSDYVVRVYNALAPIMLALNVKMSKQNGEGVDI